MGNLPGISDYKKFPGPYADRQAGICASMKNRLEGLEARLQALIENGAARLFLFGDAHHDLGSRLVAEMKANIHAQADGSFWAPNLYFVVLNPDQAHSLQNNAARLDELSSMLQRVGAQTDLRFASPPLVKVMVEPSLKVDEVQILAKYNLDILVNTSTMEVESAQTGEPAAPDAYLIVDGNRLFPLEKSLLNIGRSEENDLILNDPKVSRSHAQLRLIDKRYVIFDLGSTGGTYVNDQRVTQAVLSPGDVISLAGVPLIFGQEPARSDETQKYSPPSGDPEDPQAKPGNLEKGL